MANYFLLNIIYYTLNIFEQSKKTQKKAGNFLPFLLKYCRKLKLKTANLFS